MKYKILACMAVASLLCGSCTERRRASDPVVANGDTVEVTVGAEKDTPPPSESDFTDDSLTLNDTYE